MNVPAEEAMSPQASTTTAPLMLRAHKAARAVHESTLKQQSPALSRLFAAAGKTSSLMGARRNPATTNNAAMVKRAS